MKAVIILTFAAAAAHGAATLSVLSYGALGNGLADDTTAVQKASDACAAGTVSFPTGNYRVTRTITAHAACSYTGPGTITGYTGSGTGGFPLFQTDGNNVTFSGLTLIGGGINLAGAGWTDGLTIAGVTVQNIVSSNPGYVPARSAVFCSGVGLSNSTISGSSFSNMFLGGNDNIKQPDDPTTAILCPHVNAVTISDNTFDNLNEGIHITEGDHSAGTYDALRIQRNKFTRIHRAPIEIQTWFLTNTLIEDNSMTNYLNPYWNTFGVSFAAGAGSGAATGAIIRRNFVMMDKAAAGISGTNAGYGLEIWGNGTVADSNVVESLAPGAWSDAVAITPYNGTAAEVISNSTFCGATSQPPVLFEISGTAKGSAVQTNNQILASCAGVISPVLQAPAPPVPVPPTPAPTSFTFTCSGSVAANGMVSGPTCK